VAEADALDHLVQGQTLEEAEMRLAELAGDPASAPHPDGVLLDQAVAVEVEHAVGIAADEAHPFGERKQQLEGLAGHRSRGHVAADDDGVGAGLTNLGQHRLERG